MKLRQLFTLEWDAIAGVIAAVVAFVLHLLHIIAEGPLITIAVLLIALLFIRDLRRELATEQAYSSIEANRLVLQAIQANLRPSDVALVGPAHLRAASEQFAAHARGEMTWFHVCLSMFRPQPLFDTLLRPAVENPQVTSIQFILDARRPLLHAHQVQLPPDAGRHRRRPLLARDPARSHAFRFHVPRLASGLHALRALAVQS